MSLPPLFPHHWKKARHLRRKYKWPGKWPPKPKAKYYITAYKITCSFILTRYFPGSKQDFHFYPANMREPRVARQELRAKLRKLGVPGRAIRKICGGLHSPVSKWAMVPVGVWRAAKASPHETSFGTTRLL